MGPYTAEQFKHDMLQKSWRKHDLDEIDTIIKHGFETVKWMAGHGVPWELPVNLWFDREAQAEIMDLYPGVPLVVQRHGVGLTDAMWAAVERTSVQVFYETPAHDLIVEGDTFPGVRARRSDGFIDFYGRVILACGGFEGKPRMRRQYLGPGTEFLIVRGTKFNTGMMLERAVAAGAQAQGHWGGYHCPPLDVNTPQVGDLSVLDSMLRYSFPYSIMVNIHGKRFVDEGEDEVTLVYAKMGAAITEQPGAKAFQIFNQKVLHLLEPRYKQTGTPVADDTLEGLAKKLGIDIDNFVLTVSSFNAATRGGDFDPFRSDGVSTAPGYQLKKSNWAQRIDSSPYVAYPVTTGITFTFGGIKVDSKSRVVNAEGKIMPGLWAVGEMTGGFYFGYAAGASLVQSSVYGRIAGEDAASSTRSRSRI